MKPGDLDRKDPSAPPELYDHGPHGYGYGADGGGHAMPPNSIPMKGAVGPFGDYISMGGMFTVVKVRDRLASYDQDPVVSTPTGHRRAQG